MSALPPEADMLIVGINVGYVPFAEVTLASGPISVRVRLSRGPKIPAWARVPHRADEQQLVPQTDSGCFRATSESADYDCESRSISPEIKVELARLVPCGVTHHKIARNRKIKRQTKHAVAQGDFRHR